MWNQGAPASSSLPANCSRPWCGTKLKEIRGPSLCLEEQGWMCTSHTGSARRLGGAKLALLHGTRERKPSLSRLGPAALPWIAAAQGPGSGAPHSLRAPPHPQHLDEDAGRDLFQTAEERGKASRAHRFVLAGGAALLPLGRGEGRTARGPRSPAPTWRQGGGARASPAWSRVGDAPSTDLTVRPSVPARPSPAPPRLGDQVTAEAGI
ncbi:hypothetical protein lerEdw1_018727 [Lerista edwardsae]|nr:hypothetical protein lerEdw1_018727 [Lerista edwardsae]